MVAIFSPPPIIPEVRPSKYHLLIQENPIPYQSQERQTLQESQRRILQGLTQTEKKLNLTSENKDESYNAVPAKRTFHVKVRLKFTGRMAPLPYSLDD
jgi:uncharacterized membrane protein